MLKGGVCLLVVAIFLSLLFGGFLHAVIPHEHENETIWSTLHAALRHEDKQAITLPLAFLYIAALVLVFVARAAHTPLGKKEEAVRRGIMPYRKFG